MRCWLYTDKMNDSAELFEFINQENGLLENPNDEAAEIFVVLKRFIEAIANQKKISTKDLAPFGELVKSVSGELELKHLAGRLSWEWKKEAFANRHPAARLVRDAENLLLNEDLTRIKRCAGEGCELLFFDRSKNKSRRWCEMNHCGMLLKSKRYYDKHRKKN